MNFGKSILTIYWIDQTELEDGERRDSMHTMWHEHLKMWHIANRKLLSVTYSNLIYLSNIYNPLKWDLQEDTKSQQLLRILLHIEEGIKLRQILLLWGSCRSFNSWVTYAGGGRYEPQKGEWNWFCNQTMFIDRTKGNLNLGVADYIFKKWIL